MLHRSDQTISVRSSTIGLGAALPAHARQRISRVAGKYFGRLSAAAVHFSREGASYRCTVNIHMGALGTVSAQAVSPGIYAAFDRALEKVAKQLRRAKGAVREDKPERLDKGYLEGRERAFAREVSAALAGRSGCREAVLWRV